MLFGYNYKTKLCFTCPTTITRAEPSRFELGKGWVPADGQRPSGDSKLLILPPTLWGKAALERQGQEQKGYMYYIVKYLRYNV